MKPRLNNSRPRQCPIRARRRQRLTATYNTFTTILFVFFSVICNLSQHSFARAQRHQRRQPERPPTTSAATNGGWREWDYYQILGLLPTQTNDKNPPFGGSGSSNIGLKSRRKRSTERSKIKSKDIKKAYRTQAQTWHPDKIAARKKQQKSKQEQIQQSKNEDNKSKRTTIDSTNVADTEFSNITVEECTERFAKVAEAYEVLRDGEKRVEYDLFLLDSEDQNERDRKKEERRQQQQQQRNNGYGGGGGYGGASVHGGGRHRKRKSYFESFKADPRAVFEEFFFGGTGDDGDYGPHADDDDDMDQFMGGSTLHSFFNGGRGRNSRDNPQHRYHNVRPDRTSETTHINYDPRFEQDVHQVMRREEFDEYHELHGHRVYYRVIAQEFIEVHDDRVYSRYHTEFQPVSEPYLMDEGYIPTTRPNNYGSTTGPHHKNGGATNFNRPNHTVKTRSRHPLMGTSSRLGENTYITPQSEVLFSKNKRYYAGLTPDCELVVVEELGAGDDNPVIWSTNTFVPPQYRDAGEVCFLALYGPQLAVMAGGDVENPQAILWNSPDPPVMTPGRDGTEEETVEYYASLDDDGCLAVYRKRGSSGDGDNDSSSDSEFADDGGDSSYSIAQWWRFLLHKISPSPLSAKESPGYQPRTRAAAAWKSVRRSAVAFIRSTTKKRNFRSGIPNSESRQKRKPKDECIYASGPTGCFTPGRYVIQISKHFRRSLGKTVAKIDHAVDEFAEYLSEGSEYDIDMLDTLIRVSGRAGMVIGKSAARIAIQSVKEAKMVAEVVRHRVQTNYFRLASSIQENERGRLAYMKAQAAFGNFVDFLSESGEEDEDVLDTFVRVTGKGATHIAVTGIEEAKVAAKKIQKTIASKFVKLRSLIDTERFGFGIGT